MQLISLNEIFTNGSFISAPNCSNTKGPLRSVSQGLQLHVQTIGSIERFLGSLHLSLKVLQTPLSMGPLNQYPKVYVFPFPAKSDKALAHSAVSTGFEGIQPGHKVGDLGEFLQHVILEGFLRFFCLSVGCIHGKIALLG